MTTATWSSGNAHGTDAEFRTWGSEFSAKLLAVGLTQTADTGQINWTTVTRPGVNTDGGYEVWRFSDAAHATAPIFLKFHYGTGAAATTPRIRVEVGTASNGSGTLSGTGSGTIVGGNHCPSTGGAGSATATNSYMCYTSGFFGYVWKLTNFCQGCFYICRTCDATGAPDTYGYQLWSYGSQSGTAGNSTNYRLVRFADTGTVIYSLVGVATAPMLALAPGYPSPTTTPAGDRQAYIIWGGFPDMRPMFGVNAYLGTEFSAGSTFTTAMVGSSTRTFLATSHLGTGIVAGSSSHYLGMLYE
jgi:hypothetical protein